MKKFESYGEKLRNIITPLNLLIDIMKNEPTNFTINYIHDNYDCFESAINRCIEFSKLEELEKLNILDTDFR